MNYGVKSVKQPCCSVIDGHGKTSAVLTYGNNFIIHVLHNKYLLVN